MKNQSLHHPKQNYQPFIQRLANFQIKLRPNDRQVPIPKEQFLRDCRQDMPCPNCHQPMDRISRQYYQCPNGHRLKQTKLIQLAIEAYTSLTDSNTFKRQEIEKMLPQVKKRTLQRYLTTNFQQIGKSHSVKYHFER